MFVLSTSAYLSRIEIVEGLINDRNKESALELTSKSEFPSTIEEVRNINPMPTGAAQALERILDWD